MNDRAVEVSDTSSACDLKGQGACGFSHLNQNVGQTERLLSTGGGALLLLKGIARGRLPGLITALTGGALLYRGLTGHCYGYEALGIDSSDEPEASSVRAGQGVKIEKTIIVNRSPSDLYAFWRDLSNLPRVMSHVKQVDVLSDTRSSWAADGPLGKTLTWEAELINDREDELIAWRSLPGSQVDTAGSVHFHSLGQNRGTSLVVSLKYNPPGGKLAATAARLLGSGLEQTLDQDLRRFKSLMEASTAHAPMN